MASNPKILGALLVELEGVGRDVLADALGPGRRGRERVGETLVRLGATTPEAVARSLAAQLGIEVVAGPITAEPSALRTIDVDLLRRNLLLPISVSTRSVTIAMADPLDLTAIGDVQFQTGRRVEPVVATPSAVAEALGRYFPRSAVGAGDGGDASNGGGDPESDSDLSALVDALPDAPLSDRSSADLALRDVDLERAARDTPIVRLVDRILRDAIEQRASDIHIEETGRDVRVRLRIDGRLRQTIDIPAAARRAVLSRIKVVAGMDISVRRRAQDGRVAFQHADRRLTLRVSTLPVNGGEKAVVRILDGESAPCDLGELGMAGPDLAMLRGLIEKGEGVLLAAGPTGSGKSTTLFAALSELDRDVQNVVTLEDPVEYRLPGASQVQVDPRAGLGFAAALRSVLRQDPDVVMIGEIRDRETAEIAMAAAVTGHLVLSTIHTTDAPGAITRLLHMGVPPFLVAGGLAGIVAQRLVRRSCATCRGRGCDVCHDGVAGRTGVYQVLCVSDPIRDEISGGGSAARLRRLAAESGMKTLESDARRAVAAGLTTPHEVARFLRSDRTDGRPCRHCGGGIPFGASGCPGCGRVNGRRCACERRLEPGWRYCPWCIRPTPS